MVSRLLQQIDLDPYRLTRHVMYIAEIVIWGASMSLPLVVSCHHARFGRSVLFRMASRQCLVDGWFPFPPFHAEIKLQQLDSIPILQLRTIDLTIEILLSKSRFTATTHCILTSDKSDRTQLSLRGGTLGSMSGWQL